MADDDHAGRNAQSAGQMNIRRVDVDAEDAEPRDAVGVRLDQIGESIEIVRSLGDEHVGRTCFGASKEMESDVVARASREQLEGHSWHAVDWPIVDRKNDVSNPDARRFPSA